MNSLRTQNVFAFAFLGHSDDELQYNGKTDIFLLIRRNKFY